MHYGRSSIEYRYFYFYSDALLVILLYFALISLYSRVFEEMRVERYVRRASLRKRARSEEHTSELQSLAYLVCRLLLEKKKNTMHGKYFVGITAPSALLNLYSRTYISGVNPAI